MHTYLRTCRRTALLIGSVLATAALPAQPRAVTGTPRHTFALSATDFLLDGAPFRIRAGEMHPARIPAQYWRHRIRMAKALGLNTIATYVFWNHHETTEGRFDFATGNRDIARFIRMVAEEGMWVLLRPGPYVCAEWDFGGLPTYLLRDPELRVRSMYPRYIAAADRYITRLAREVRPLLVTNGGPILMVQIENEYGSYGNDRRYLLHLRDAWRARGIDVPFYTADGPTDFALAAGHVPGAAVGLDPGASEADWQVARAAVPGVPVFSAETYPGWLTHWGEAWAAPSVDALKREMTFLLETGKSFSLYVVHGGTNFGFTAGANSGGKGYEPDLTSYDYDAPIDEQGRPTAKYEMLRTLIGGALPPGEVLAPIPAPIPATAVASFAMTPWASLWNHLPAPIAAVHPRPFEHYGQNQGLVLYRTTLVGRTHGTLTVTSLHDFATVFLDGVFVGTIDRRLGQSSIELPRTGAAAPQLDLLVEGMGHINYGPAMIDRKGITDRVTLSGMTLMNWQVHLFPLTEGWVRALPQDATPGTRPGLVFRGEFSMETPTDTYLDLSGYGKGVVWVNGHNLGRFWEIGPQQRLYVPATLLRAGRNEVRVLDLVKTAAVPIVGMPTLR